MSDLPALSTLSALSNIFNANPSKCSLSSSAFRVFLDLKASRLSITLKRSSSTALSLFSSFIPSSTAYRRQ